MWLVERLESELVKSEPKGQDQMAKTHKIISKGIENYNVLNRGPQTINYNI